MSAEKHKAALAAVQAFDMAAGVMTWEHSPLSPRSDGHASLQQALLAKINGVEAAAFRRFSRKWWKHRDREMVLWEKERPMSEARARAAFAAARRRLKAAPAS